MLHLTDLQVDALKEVANIGAGHAATALSQLLGTTIRLEAPRAEVIQFQDLHRRIAQGRTLAIVHVRVSGDVPGRLVVLFDRKNALGFVALSVKRVTGDLQIFDELVERTLQKLTDLVASSYIGAIVELSGAKMQPSAPVFTYGSLRATLDALMPISPGDDVFFVESTFVDRDAMIRGHLVFVPDAGSLEPLFAAFGLPS
jgi:chemotaxis protein CheC